VTRLAPSLMLALVPALVGCVADGPQPAPRPEPRVIQEPPGLEPRTLVISAEPFPVDTDENGYVDTFRVSAFIFPDQRTHPVPTYADGTFVFEMTDEEGERIARWELGQDRVERARVRPLVGPGHVFTLSLLDVGSDRTPLMRGNLTCSFIPAGKTESEAVVARGAATLRIGPTGLAGAGE